ncbi:hydroxylysine kinase-like, partial [Saccoglossus kowalevskii]|uniref:Hydroxylysine kinase n=1 Tax=Saccoglossus kowalevskii TaxID=10224 RepID=A0ABM0MT76_SACKO
MENENSICNDRLYAGVSEADNVTYEDFGKPDIQKHEVQTLVESNYSVKVERLEELVSCVDQNFHVSAKCTTGKNVEFVLKILCLKRSQQLQPVEGMIKCMLYLNDKSIHAPVPVIRDSGDYVTLYKTDNGYHAVYMLKYISGMPYSEIIQPSATMSYNAGSLLGRIDNALKDFYHNGFEYDNAVFKSDDVTSVQKSLYVIENDKRRQLIGEVISAFKEQVIPNIGKLRKGIIHGDYNPYNVIVSKNRLLPRTDSDKNVNHDIKGP